MKPLPESFTEKRPSCRTQECWLEELIKKIEGETKPVDFREQLLSIIQLYFDGLLSQKTERYGEEALKQEKILNGLYLAGKKSVGAHYRGEEVDLDCLKEIFLPYASEIVGQNPEGRANFRHLTNCQTDVYNLGLELPNISDKPFDTLVCVASGGFEPSFLAMDIMETDSLIPIRYSRYRQNDREVKVLKKTSTDYLKKIEGKRVLVIEDWIRSGGSLANAIKYVTKIKPSELYGVAVISNCSPSVFKFKVNFNLSVEEVNQKDPYVYKIIAKTD